MPPTEHHPVTEHPLLCRTALMNKRTHFQKRFKMTLLADPGLEKMCSTFLHFTPGHLILVRSFGCGKVSTLSKQLCAVLGVGKYISK